MNIVIGELDLTKDGTFDASGRATAFLGPERASQLWRIKRVTVSTTSSTKTQCKLYRTAESPSRQLDNTPRGNSDTSEDNSYEFRTPEKLLAVWTGGTVGAVATLNIIGTIEAER